jgi:hypothetical protein
MTTQHAPHTTPLWRRVLSRPHTRLRRWGIGLTAGAALLLIFGLFLNVNAGLDVSPWVWMILIAGILAGAVVGRRRFLSPPQTRLGWWAVVLASPVWALWYYGMVSEVGLYAVLKGEALAAEGVILGLLFTGPFALPGAIAGLIAVLEKHERSWMIWVVALLPALLFLADVIFIAAFLG